MRSIFLKWLFAFIVAAFTVTFCVSFYMQTQQAKHNAAELISLKINDVIKQIEQNNNNLARIKNDNNKTAIVKSKMLAYLIQKNYGKYDIDYMLNLTQFLDVDEINIVNDKGIIIASSKPEYINFNMNNGDQSAEFNEKFFLQKKDTFVQELRGISYNKNIIMQYAGAKRTDAPGYVQIAYTPKRLIQAQKVADIKYIGNSMRIGIKGKMLICKNNKIISASNNEWLNQNISDYNIDISIHSPGTPFTIKLNNQNYICKYQRHNGYIIIGLLPTEEMFVNRNTSAIQLIIFNIILYAIIFILISLLVERIVINGILKVNQSLEKITQGDLEEVVNVKTNKEFISLSNGINQMVNSLKRLIAEAKAHLDAELKFAHQIQTSSLPNIFPPYPEKKEFEIFASMHTAKEVGGDFYDFFLIDDNHLGIVIADVSGKGVPAALFMMTSKTLIKTLAESGMSCNEVFDEANNRLCQNNDANMFVTAFLGILDLKTGNFNYVNAGHNPPLLKRAADKFDWLKEKSGPMLGCASYIRYKKKELIMAPDDTIYLYTDGVTEAMNSKNELFSDYRLYDVINKYKNSSLKELLKQIKTEIDDFTKEAPQADDITMLLLKYKG